MSRRMVVGKAAKTKIGHVQSGKPQSRGGFFEVAAPLLTLGMIREILC